MHAALRFLAAFCLFVGAGFAHAQLATGRYGSAQVFDVQRSPAFPLAGLGFTVSNFANPVQGGVPFRYTLAAGEQVGFVEVSSDPCRYSLTIYDSGGSLVRTVHPSGTIYGLGTLGFLHVSEPGDYGTFVANAAGYALGDSLSYVPTTGAATCAETASYAANTTPISTVTPKYAVGGTISSLTAAGLVLRLNGVTTLGVSSGATTFSFPAIANGTAYSVDVATQPAGQNCLVFSPMGTVNGADVTTIQIDCRYTVAFTVSGVQANTFVTVFDGVDSLGGFRNGSHFTVKTNTQAYALSVPTSPAGHVCAVTGPATGVISGAGVGGIAVSCDPIEYLIGGKTSPASAGPAGIVGLAPGNTVRLRLDYTAAVDPCASASGAVTCKVSANGSEEKDFTQNGDFSFATQLNTGDGYTLSVATNGDPVTPYPQTCTPGTGAITKGTIGVSGTVGTNDIDFLKADCAPLYYALDGEVVGLAAGNSVELRNNGADSLTVNADGNVRFATLLANGSPYAVTVQTQPTTPNQTCAVEVVGKTGGPGQGVINGSNGYFGRIACVTTTYAVGGSVSGLAGSGLVLQLNGGGNLAIAADGSFSFPALADGSAFAVTVLSQPTSPNQVCTVTAGSGTLTGANVTGVAVTCVTNSVSVGGTASGLASGNSVTLRKSVNGVDEDLVVSANAPFSFATPVPEGANYLIAVLSQPTTPEQTCTVTDGSGTAGTSAISNVGVACNTNTYTVGGTVSGLAGSGLVLQLNGGSSLAVAGNGSFTFGGLVPSGETYAVTVATQPSSPSQTCVVSNGSGSVGAAAISNVSISCAANSFTVGGTVSGLSGAGLALQLNGSGTLPITANGSFSFPALTDLSAYTVTVSAQPSAPTQVCVVGNGTGTLAGANIGNVTVTCTTSSFSVGGSVSGLVGSGLVLRNNGGNDVAIGSNGSFSFSAPVASGQPYAVSVATQPAGPAQTCSINGGSGVVGAANITSVVVTCSTSSFTIGGSVSGLVGAGLVLQLNGGVTLPVAANGSFAFPAIADGSNYTVSVATQPASPAQVCSVGNGSGTLAGANVSAVTVSCVTTVLPPGPPSNVQISISGSTATVSWTAPANNGGGPITSYTVTALPGGLSCTVTGNPPPTSCQISGLVPDQPYTFNVVATNAAGGGAIGGGIAGTASAVVIPVDQPWALLLLATLLGLMAHNGLRRRRDC